MEIVSSPSFLYAYFSFVSCESFSFVRGEGQLDFEDLLGLFLLI
jgi:hypothetical protein